jgi:hypothetical protein
VHKIIFGARSTSWDITRKLTYRQDIPGTFRPDSGIAHREGSTTYRPNNGTAGRESVGITHRP